MSAQPLSVSDATRRILEDLGLDTALRGKAALHAAREELGLEPAPTDSKLRTNLQEVAAELGIELGWAPAQRTSPSPVGTAATVGARQREAVTKAPVSTKAPTKNPTKAPSRAPTKAPTKNPTKAPSRAPTKAPIAPPPPPPKPTSRPTSSPPPKSPKPIRMGDNSLRPGMAWQPSLDPSQLELLAVLRSGDNGVSKTHTCSNNKFLVHNGQGFGRTNNVMLSFSNLLGHAWATGYTPVSSQLLHDYMGKYFMFTGLKDHLCLCTGGRGGVPDGDWCKRGPSDTSAYA